MVAILAAIAGPLANANVFTMQQLTAAVVLRACRLDIRLRHRDELQPQSPAFRSDRREGT
jgi:hypothetical protein